MAFLDFQLSIFCNQKIDATPENSYNIMKKINDLGEYVYLPSVSQEQNYNILDGRIQKISNLIFITNNQKSQINCMTDRIDVIIRYNENLGEDYHDNDAIYCINLLKTLVDEYGITANRLAINVNMLGESYKVGLDKTNISESLILSLGFNIGKPVKEWSTRCNVAHTIYINELSEELNIISELTEVKKNGTDEKKIMYHIDLNTSHTNNMFRFNGDHISPFVEQGMSIVSELKSNFEEMKVNG